MTGSCDKDHGASPEGTKSWNRFLSLADELEGSRKLAITEDVYWDDARYLDPQRYAQYGFSISPEQGRLLYVLCRAARAKMVVEVATSWGMSTLFLAAAVRDNGGGSVIGSEIVPVKAADARRHLHEAGLSEFAEVRVGDARETLRNLSDLDFAYIDGWPTARPPSLAREIIESLAPKLRPGGVVVKIRAPDLRTRNAKGRYAGEDDYYGYVEDRARGFRSFDVPIGHGLLISVKDPD